MLAKIFPTPLSIYLSIYRGEMTPPPLRVLRWAKRDVRFVTIDFTLFLLKCLMIYTVHPEKKGLLSSNAKAVLHPMRFVGNWFKPSPPIVDETTGERYPMHKWRTLDCYKENAASSMCFGAIGMLGLCSFLLRDQNATISAVAQFIYGGRHESVAFVFVLFVSSLGQDLLIKRIFSTLQADVSNILYDTNMVVCLCTYFLVAAQGANRSLKRAICNQLVAGGEREGAICY